MKKIYKSGERVRVGTIIILLILAPLKLFAGSYDQEIEKYSSQYRLDPDLVRAVIQVESKYRRFATSKAGAMGLMQIMPATFEEWSRKCNISYPDVFNPDHNIHVGCAYLRWCIKHAGSVKRGLIAYNRGLTRGRRENWQVEWYYERVMKAQNREPIKCELFVGVFVGVGFIILLIGNIRAPGKYGKCEVIPEIWHDGGGAPIYLEDLIDVLER